MTEEIAQDLARSGWTIVSGMARGSMPPLIAVRWPERAARLPSLAAGWIKRIHRNMINCAGRLRRRGGIGGTPGRLAAAES